MNIRILSLAITLAATVLSNNISAQTESLRIRIDGGEVITFKSLDEKRAYLANRPQLKRGKRPEGQKAFRIRLNGEEFGFDSLAEKNAFLEKRGAKKGIKSSTSASSTTVETSASVTTASAPKGMPAKCGSTCGEQVCKCSARSSSRTRVASSRRTSIRTTSVVHVEQRSERVTPIRYHNCGRVELIHFRTQSEKNQWIAAHNAKKGQGSGHRQQQRRGSRGIVGALFGSR